MIKIQAELLDLDSGLCHTVAIPSDLTDILDKTHEYYIISCEPNIDEWMVDDIWKLNQFADEINSENPEMTAPYVNILISAADVRDVLDEEFMHKLKENEFMFEDITNCSYDLGLTGKAAKYLAKDAHVPFDSRVPQYIVNAMMNKEAEEYIDWPYIWRKYVSMGFQIIEIDDGPAAGEYVILW